MRYPLVLLALWFGTIAQAGDHPRWPALAELLKEAKDSNKVSTFVGAHSLSEATKGPSGSFSSADRAFSLLYRDSRICALVLRVSDWPEGYGEQHWKRYSEKLPGKLSATDGRAAVVEKLGEPVTNRKATWLHDGLYLWIHFNEAQTQIDEIFVSPQVIEASPK